MKFAFLQLLEVRMVEWYRKTEYQNKTCWQQVSKNFGKGVIKMQQLSGLTVNLLLKSMWP